MKKIWQVLVCGAAMVMFLAGCASNEDSLMPSDLTLAEVEKRIDKATDPNGAFAKSRTYTMLQQISVPRFLDDPEESLMEVKFEHPAKFCMISYEDNQPVSTVCSDGKSGWVADHRNRKIKILDGTELRRVQVMSQLGNPRESYLKIFPKVEIYRCTNEEGNFYRIDCYGEGQKTPVSVYVDDKDFFIRRMKFDLPVGSGNLDYDARIIQYELRDGVMIPVLTEITQNGEKMESRITSYKLNAPIPETDFVPPVF